MIHKQTFEKKKIIFYSPLVQTLNHADNDRNKGLTVN